MSGQSGSGGDGWDDFLSGLKVMVVDDDPLCLKVVEHMLRRCSYTGSQRRTLVGRFLTFLQQLLHTTSGIAVTTCPNGVTALERLRDKSQHYDLVLSDVYMPGRGSLWPLPDRLCSHSSGVTTSTYVLFLQMWMALSCLSKLG